MQRIGIVGVRYSSDRLLTAELRGLCNESDTLFWLNEVSLREELLRQVKSSFVVRVAQGDSAIAAYTNQLLR